MKKVQLCIFDMDGLLLDTERQMWAVNQMKAASSLGINLELDYIATLMGSGREIYSQGLIKKYGTDFPMQEFWKIVDSLNAVMLENDPPRVRPGGMELLDFLKENNIKIAVGTSTKKALATTMLGKNNILDYFDQIVCGDDVLKAKPNPDIYLKCHSYFDIPKEDVLIFEDGHNGSRSAINAEMNYILVPDLAIVTKQDRDEAFKVINSLDEAIGIIKEINKI